MGAEQKLTLVGSLASGTNLAGNVAHRIEDFYDHDASAPELTFLRRVSICLALYALFAILRAFISGYRAHVSAPRRMKLEIALTNV